MNRPFTHRLAGVVSSPVAAPVNPIGADGLASVRTGRPPHPTEAAGAPNRLTPAKQACLSCDGEGTVEILPLDAVRPYCATCDDCDGSGYAKQPYCPTCESKLTVDGWCYDCDDWGSLVYVERIAPGRVAL